MKKETNGTKQRLVLLDAHAILHRAYHALPDFSSRSGEPTGALYGVVAMLLKIATDLNPDYIVACYDLPKPTHRHEAYKDYKAGRAAADDELVQQIERSRDIFDAFAIPIYECEGFEADDILGTIVESVKRKKSVEIVIASGDMDTLQLVDDKRVQVYTLKKGIKDTILYDEKAVHERFGFGPELLPDYKGLRGDPSDNIPGIAGIGEKTATTLLTTFGSIDALYAQLKKDSKVFEKKGIKPRIVKLLTEGEEEAEFSRLLGTIRRDAPINFTLPKTHWKESVDTKVVLDLFSNLGFRTLSQRFRDMFDVVEEVSKTQPLSNEENEALLKETSVALWVLNSDMTSPSREDILDYTKTTSLKDAHTSILSELKKQDLLPVYETIEKPLIPVIETMSRHGVLIDTTYLQKLSKKYHAELAKLETQIFKHAGTEFNINSPRQLADILFDTLGLKPKNQKKTATGQRSTRESELVKLQGEHPIIDVILEYRELQKLLSTYIDPLPQMVAKDARLHTEFLQAGTTTGRMASRNPNLQNIPIRSERGKVIRNAFIAPKGSVLIACDYSQIELRLAAILSGDEKLQNAFKEGKDIHTAVASEVFDVVPERVTPDMRRKAKIINFGILYGMGVNALAKAIDAPRKDAQQFLKSYFERFPKLAEYMSRMKGDVAQKGYTETLYGRRRYLPGIHSSVPFLRAEAERMAINAPIQGTQADIIKIAMVQIDAWLKKEKMHSTAQLVLQIHDELVYEVAHDHIDAVISHVTEIMESVLSEKQTHGVPIKVDVAVGENWGEMEKANPKK